MAIPHAKVIINPEAGAGSTHRKWPKINERLKNAGLSFDHEFTEGAGHAIELASTAVNNGYLYLVAVGGDGTVHEIANGILHSNGLDSTALGVLSTGTGSDFARSIGIPRNHDSGCSYLTSTRRLLIDVGIVEYIKDGQA